MFVVRGLAVTLSVFALVYGGLSLAVCCSWRRLWWYAQKWPARRLAGLLFALRMFPLLGAAAITATFTVPSFVLLEPRSIDEPLGAAPLVLSLCAAAFGTFGVVSAGKVLWRARRAIASWTNQVESMNIVAPVPVLRIAGAVPPMTATGIMRPRVLLSGAVELLLTPNELQTALNHELAHVQRRDNLKKLLLRFVAFPGMGELEAAWVEATELAADDAAVSTTREALDLAAALLKVSRLALAEDSVELTAALVRTPATAMQERVERLIAWKDDRAMPEQSHRWPAILLSPVLTTAVLTTAALIMVFAGGYGHLLVVMHTATELLVR